MRLSFDRALGGVLPGKLWRARGRPAQRGVGARAGRAAGRFRRARLPQGVAARSIWARASGPNCPPACLASGSTAPSSSAWCRASGPNGTRGLFEPGCADIDVAGLHAAYLAAFRRAGGDVAHELAPGQRRAAWRGVADRACRRLDPSRAQILVNAAGAWADQVAAACGNRPARAHHPCAGPWSSCGSGEAASRTCRWSTTRRGQFYFKGEGDRRSGSARTTRSPASRATRRPRKSTSRPRSTASSGWSTGRSSGSSGAGRACGPSRPTACRSTASTPPPPAFSGARGRAASGSRPRPLRREWPRPCCWRGIADADGLAAIDPASFTPGALAALSVSAACPPRRRRAHRRGRSRGGRYGP